MLRPAILGLLLVSLAWGYGRGRPSVEELCKSADWGFLGTDARSHRQVARYLGPARNWQSPIELPPLPDAAHLPWSELCLDGKPIRIGGSRGSVLT